MWPFRSFAGKINENIAGDEEMIRALSPQILPSVESMVRDQLQGIDVAHEVKGSLLDGMTKEQETDFCEKALDVLKNPTFLMTIHHLIAQQVDYTVKRASSMDEVLFGRATINGLSLLKEQFEFFAARAEELAKVEEKFEPSDVI